MEDIRLTCQEYPQHLMGGTRIGAGWIGAGARQPPHGLGPAKTGGARGSKLEAMPADRSPTPTQKQPGPTERAHERGPGPTQRIERRPRAPGLDTESAGPRHSATDRDRERHTEPGPNTESAGSDEESAGEHRGLTQTTESRALGTAAPRHRPRAPVTQRQRQPGPDTDTDTRQRAPGPEETAPGPDRERRAPTERWARQRERRGPRQRAPGPDFFTAFAIESLAYEVSVACHVCNTATNTR